MLYTLYKLVVATLQPSSLTVILLLAGTALVLADCYPRLGRRLLAIGGALLVLIGVLPAGNLLVLPLEQRFPRAPLPETVDGIILLGGFEVTGVSAARGRLEVNESADRLIETVALAQRLPGARVIFTGGDGELLTGGGSAAAAVATFLETAGVARTRIVLEDRSRTTYENALYLKAMIAPHPGQRFLLVTSAYHMPRAIGTFRRHGFDVAPWPVDYRTAGSGAVLSLADSPGAGMMRTDLAFKEWLGLVAYRLAGRSDALWPEPTSGLAR